jgi:hypothetical protein
VPDVLAFLDRPLSPAKDAAVRKLFKIVPAELDVRRHITFSLWTVVTSRCRQIGHAVVTRIASKKYV